jgi:nucleotide-binding universal stress UspA family protein
MAQHALEHGRLRGGTMTTPTGGPHTENGPWIVVGYDGSTTSHAALRWAVDEAAHRSCGIRIVYAIPPTMAVVPQFGGFDVPDLSVLDDAAAEIVEAAHAEVRAKAPDLHVETRILHGTAAPGLLAEAPDAVMLVVGSRGLGGFAELLVGSTGVQLASHAECPVVVLRPVDPKQAEGAQPGPNAGRIVVGVDGSPAADAALGFAFKEAALRGIGITAVHAWIEPTVDPRGPNGEPMASYVSADETQGTEVRLLEDALAGWTQRYPAVDVRESVLHADPVATLLAAASGATMLVVGSRGRGGFSSLLLGSVSHGVLHHATGPVVIVRHPAS